WLSMPPATGTHTGVWHPAGNEQGPAATTKSACASSCLSESGLTTGCRQAAGSRRCVRLTEQHTRSHNQSSK
ncbi:hypothetical protein GBS52_25125, partial [Escherichia coli]|nr:hypothetical protein [Escherichia coli]